MKIFVTDGIELFPAAAVTNLKDALANVTCSSDKVFWEKIFDITPPRDTGFVIDIPDALYIDYMAARAQFIEKYKTLLLECDNVIKQESLSKSCDLYYLCGDCFDDIVL